MCKCITELEKNIVGRDWKKKKVIKANFISGALMFSSGTYQASGEVEATLEGGKKPVKIPIIYSHCPFCGKAYPKPKN